MLEHSLSRSSSGCESNLFSFPAGRESRGGGALPPAGRSAPLCGPVSPSHQRSLSARWLETSPGLPLPRGPLRASRPLLPITGRGFHLDSDLGRGAPGASLLPAAQRRTSASCGRASGSFGPGPLVCGHSRPNAPPPCNTRARTPCGSGVLSRTRIRLKKARRLTGRGLKCARQDSNLRPLRSAGAALYPLSYGRGEGKSSCVTRRSSRLSRRLSRNFDSNETRAR